MNHSKLCLFVILLFCIYLGGCQTINEERVVPRYQSVIQIRPLEERQEVDQEVVKINPRSSWTNEGPVIFDIHPMTSIYRVTIHHTAMPDDEESDLGGSMKLRLQKILYLHKHKQNWADIGYHYIIDQRGNIWEGRNIKYQGAHAQGNNNLGNIGVALIGNFETHYAPEVQKKSLVDFVHYLKEKYKIRSTNIFPHEHFTGTKCPGKHIMPLVEQLRKGL